MPIATDLITLTQTAGRPKGVGIYYPVFTTETGSDGRGRGELRGFVLAVLRTAFLLEQVGKGADLSVHADLIQLHAHAAPEFLASTDQQDQEYHESHHTLSHVLQPELTITYPAFAFGKTYAIVAMPGTGFSAPNPMHAAWLAALIALTLTGVVTAFVGGMSRRHAALHSQIHVRTSELRESQALGHSLMADRRRAEDRLHASRKSWNRRRCQCSSRTCWATLNT